MQAIDNRKLAIDLIDHYLNFLSFEKNKFLIPEDNENIVFLPENCIAEILESIKNKGYGNFDLFQVINDEELSAKIKELIEKINEEPESELKIAFAFPVIKIKDKNFYYAFSKMELNLYEGKLFITSREFNKEFIETFKKQSNFANKDEIKIPEDGKDHKEDFEFFITIIELFAGLSHLHVITLPEPFSAGIVTFSIINSIRKIKERLIGKKNQEEISSKIVSKENMKDLDEEKLGIIYIYPTENYTQKIRYDLQKIKENFDEETVNKISLLWNHEYKRNAEDASLSFFPILYDNLTKSQKEAYNSMIKNMFSLIEGPPGTGKTHLIAIFAADMILDNKKTIITSTNNKAVDNVYQKLKEFDEKNKHYLKTGKILHGYVRLGSSNYVKSFVEHLFTFINELEQLTPQEIEENIAQLSKEVATLESFFEKYTLKKNFSNAEFENYFKDTSSIKKFDYGHLSTFTYLLKKLNTWYANLFPFSLLVGKKYKEALEQFCEEKGLILPALKDKRYLSCKEIYLREKNTSSFLERVSEFNKLEREIEILAEEVQNLIQENTNDIEQLFKKAGEIYYFRKRELKYWQLANDKKWLTKIEEKKAFIEKGQFWGLEDYLFKLAPVIITTALTSPAVCKPDVDIIDYVIVDEAAQTHFCYTFSLFIRGKHFIAIGDDNQLGPVITNIDYIPLIDIEPHLTCDKSVYEVVKALTNYKYTGLKEHFRCAKSIIEFCNELINYGLIIETTEDRLDIKHSPISNIFEKNLTFIDVRGHSRGKQSKYNEEEINKIVDLIHELAAQIDLKQVGIIAPYRLQVEKLKNRLKNFKNLTIGTVHTFQGEERDIIILSCVCGSAEEFQRSKLLTEKKLINVAVSRARKHLIVVGNKDAIESISETGGFVSPIKKLLNHILKQGAIIS